MPIPPQVTFDPSTNVYSNGYCVDTGGQCPVCDTQHQINNQGSCSSISDANAAPVAATHVACKTGEGCDPGFGCINESNVDQSPPLSICLNNTCDTAIGPLPTTLTGLLTTVFSIALSIAGVVALGLIIASGYRLMISQGNPEQVKGAREQLTAAIIGLLFIIFSLVILQIIGVNILNIPGFG
jgi:hypothetical protein